MKTKVLIVLIVIFLLGGSMSFSPAAAQGDWGIEKGNLGLPETGRQEGEAAAWDDATPRAERMRSKEQGGFNCSQVVALGYLKSECEALVAFYHSTNGAGWNDNGNWLATPNLGIWHGLYFKDLLGKQVVDRIDLMHNQLSGSIPAGLGNLTNLTILYLSGNQLSGSIPAELGNLTNLTDLYLRSNQLSGSIPGELGNLTNLIYLYLDHNQLSGSIPAEIGGLTALRVLDLSHNHLWGNVPASITNLTALCVEGQPSPDCPAWFYTDFGHNMLFVPQPEPPQSFMNTKDPDWADTQRPPIRNYLPAILKGQ
jgi:hypothetical protein